jgi:hypothetical protein
MRLWSALAAVTVLALGTITLRAEAAAPFGSDDCPGVAPGAEAQDATGNIYTMGFFFKGVKGKDKATYFATVGDQFLPDAGTRTWKGTAGPSVKDADDKVVGHFVYAYRQDTPAADSFGLVRVNAKVKWTGTVCHFGGPTGLYTATTSTPFAVQFYGQGIPYFFFVPARTGLAFGSTDKDHIFVAGAVGSFGGFGDQGAPVLANGSAVGIFSGAAGGGGEGFGFSVSRLGPELARAQKATGIKLSLLTYKAL